MKSYHIFYGFIISSILVITNAYDIGCLYPSETRDPWDVREALSNYITFYIAPDFETPTVVRASQYWGMCQALCTHYHDPRVSNPNDFSEWNIPIPKFAQNAFSTTMCIVQCDAHLVYSTGDERGNDFVKWAHEELHLDIFNPKDEVLEDIKEATLNYYDEGERKQLGQILFRDNYHPFLLGHIAGFYAMSIADNDGWNADGGLRYSPETNEVVPCTGSCRNFQDLIDYAPKPDPRTYPDVSTDDDKYSCTGLCRHWQPLQEDNMAGKLHRQEHVTPHIGTHARTWLRNVTSTLEDPMYDLHAESLKVIEQLKMTSSDDYKKEMVRYFDDKLNIRTLIRVGMREQYKDFMSLHDYFLFVYGLSLVEYDGVVQAWHEKVIHDMVRPTTVIKHWDTDILETFGGDITHDGPVNIKARDFEALVRVMPHGEFPSGSSCLCTGYMEYADEYTKFFFNSTITNIVIQKKHLFANMTEVRDTCSVSRLWGGMHYEAAIPAGEQICEGLGTLGLDFIVNMKNNSIPFQGVDYYRGDARPTCIERK